MNLLTTGLFTKIIIRIWIYKLRQGFAVLFNSLSSSHQTKFVIKLKRETCGLYLSCDQLYPSMTSWWARDTRVRPLEWLNVSEISCNSYSKI